MSGFPQPTLNPILAGTHNFPNANGLATNFGNGLGSGAGRPNLNAVRALTIVANVSIANSTVLASVPAFSFSGLALTTYEVTAVLRYTAAAGTGDLKVGFNVTGALAAYHISGARVDASGATVLIDDQTGTVTVQGAGATVRCVVITATVVFGLAAGTATLQFAQNTSSATATILQASSTMSYRCAGEFITYGASPSQRFRVALIGDSISSGESSSTYQPAYWGTWFRKYIAGITGLPDGGPGVRLTGRTIAGMEFTRTGVWTDPSPGDNTLAYNKAPGFRLHFSSDNTAVLTYTKPAGEAASLRAELSWIDGPSSGDIQASFDGGPFVALGLGPNQNNALKTFMLPGQFTTTVALRNNQAGGTMYPVCLALYDGYSGVVVDVYAIGGITAQEYVGGTNGADSLFVPATNYVPQIVFIQFGANEMILQNLGGGAAANALTNYSANLTTIANRFTALGSDVVFLFGPRMAVNAGFANLILYGQLENQMRAVAATLNLPIIDVAEAWGDWTTANANGLMFDQYHPIGGAGLAASAAAGHRNIASRAAAAISAAVC